MVAFNVLIMDDSATMRALRQNQMWLTIPLVLVTSEGCQEVLAPFFEKGVQGYIRKLFRPEDIKEKLQKHIGGGLGAPC